MAEPSTVRLDLRAVLPVAALGVIILVIIFVELCGREDTPSESPPLVEAPTEVPTTPEPTPTPGPTATPGPSPTPAPEEATATQELVAGAEERDAARLADLESVQQALEEYHDERGDYPDSGGNVQSLCVFDADAGCQLEEFLSPIPIDPLGEPIAENGYWYQSDGDEFTVYAQRETDQFPECPQHPEHLEDLDSVLCIQGP